MTGRNIYLKENHPTREAAEVAKIRLIGRLEVERIPPGRDGGVSLDRWIEVADHELAKRETNEGYIR
jgi:hypothetical protein